MKMGSKEDKKNKAIEVVDIKENFYSDDNLKKSATAFFLDTGRFVKSTAVFAATVLVWFFHTVWTGYKTMVVKAAELSKKAKEKKVKNENRNS